MRQEKPRSAKCKECYSVVFAFERFTGSNMEKWRKIKKVSQ